MNPKGKKFIALFLILSFLAINCITLKLPERKVRQGTSTESKQAIISYSELAALKPGTRVVMILKSGDRVSGKFSKYTIVPSEEYAEIYSKSREQLQEKIMLPALGETITIITKRRGQYEREFLGFDYGTISLRKKGKAKYKKMNVRQIRNIKDSRGNIIGVDIIGKLLSEGKIPLLSSGIVIENKIGPTQIGWEDVYQIQVKKKGMPMFAKLALGGAAIYLFIQILEGISRGGEETIENVNELFPMDCFVMTAAYGSPLHPYVKILRDFRDKYLMPGKLGRKLVELYYKHSPYFADLIVKHKALKVVVRINLLPFVVFSYSMVHFGPIVTAIMLVLIFALPIFLISFFRKKA